VTAKPSTCAICKKPLEAEAAQKSPLYPFCSQRCKQVDLLRWCKGEYAVVNDMDPEALIEMEEERRAQQGEGEF
jgi:endogenous inhibitor of DNA gyrase (YacG/DUF329 family)